MLNIIVDMYTGIIALTDILICSAIYNKVFINYCITAYTYLIDKKTAIYSYFRDIYLTHPQIKESVDRTTYGWNYLYAKIIDKQIVPYSNQWVSISFLKSDESKQNYTYYELYSLGIQIKDDRLIDEVGNPANLQCDLLLQSFYNYCQYVATFFNYTNCIREIMVTFNNNGKYIHYFFIKDKCKYHPIRGELDDLQTNTFFSVTYIHPFMKNHITLELNDLYYYANTIILSPIHVKRCLELQNEPYIFDMDYKIEFIDDAMNLVTLRSNQCICLEYYDKEDKKNIKYEVITL